ncbi:single-stranded DNA-binding protein [Leekyejoonella antrihumi]|uniref:Single-stranded DNA-binding protein n=1 Tax=Leekyejoonella antrihumi TaxID=1660198 RepID=A0A563DY60_9MICO|nr:single-stranded DNA-binding protein [Leekyejoonella antrihumi]TWP34902.1 single-stranded DNA-binding protein [Leekyejoonella antrihumi]
MDEVAQVNEVRLVGRLSVLPVQRLLPSGDELVTLRVVVKRPQRRSGGRVRGGVDAIEVVCWSARTRRRALTLAVDDIIDVSGALRRRFWRGGSGVTSMCEVEATSISRVARSA